MATVDHANVWRVINKMSLTIVKSNLFNNLPIHLDKGKLETAKSNFSDVILLEMNTDQEILTAKQEYH